MKNSLTIGNTVYFSFSEEYWDKPFARKRHHVPEYRSVVLKGKVTDIKGNEFKALLNDNNDFEKDGEEFVFSKGCLLSNQDYNDTASLGKWNK